MANKTYLTQRDYMEMPGAEPPSDFVMLEAAARKRIDYLTASRVAKMEVVPDAVKLCMLSIMRLDAKAGALAQVSSPVATSFSTDGYSESYGKVLGAAEVGAEMTKTIKMYLYGEKDDRGIPLLYRGVEHDASV